MTPMDRKKFYDTIRNPLFGGSLTTSQVAGLEAMIDEYERRKSIVALDYRWFAYILGTAYHEVARTMQPIEEYGKGRGRPYGGPDPITGKAYYGRGFVQLTWKANYKKMGAAIGVNLVEAPEKALELDNATKIIFVGMLRGDFARDHVGIPHKLDRYFDGDHSDWYGARRIVNGLDKAQAIANYALVFYKAILKAEGFTPVARFVSAAPPVLTDGEDDDHQIVSDFMADDEASEVISE
jgi:putative chitinase